MDSQSQIENSTSIYFLKYVVYLFLEREEGEGKERETLICETLIGCLSHAPNQGPALQPRDMP